MSRDISKLTFLVVADYQKLVTMDTIYRIRSTRSRPYMYVSEEAKKLKSEIKSQIRPIPSDILERILCYDIHCVVFSDQSYWMTKDGRLKRRDITNVFKVVEDAIAEGLGVDDKYARKVIVEKRISDNFNSICSLITLFLSSGNKGQRISQLREILL